MKKIVIAMLLAGPFASCLAQTPILNACSGMSLGPNGALNGFVPAPTDAWHTDISAAPLDPMSDAIINVSGNLAGAHLHPDFGSGAYGYYGIPYEVVDSRQTPSVPVGIRLYANDSDITLAPIPADAPLEGNPGSCPSGGDRHLIVLDRNKCVAYEYWQGSYCNSAWTASNTALFDMSVTTRRPYGLTSADAAGLSIFEGLIRYDEIVAGSINHAIRFTAQHTKNNAAGGVFTAPATHASGTLWGTNNVIGMRIRLRSNFDVSGYSLTNRIILNAMKKYGMILADNGSNMFFQGTPDSRWNDDDLNKLKLIPSTAFEVVKMATQYDVNTAPKGAAPHINSFTASATSVASGSPVTLTANVTGASYSYVDNAGFYRGPIVVSPTSTTTYTLTSRNEFGTSKATVTVTVGPPTPLLPSGLKVALSSVNGAQFTVAATSASPAAITYSVLSGPAIANGATVTFSASGTAVVSAAQAATSTYAAGTATVSLAYTKPAPLSPALQIVTSAIDGSQFTVSASTASPGAITYRVLSGPAMLNGTVLKFSGSGTAVVQAAQAATSAYAAGTATVSLAYTASKPVLASGLRLGYSTRGGDRYAIIASTSSPGPITYTVLSGPAVITAFGVSFTGTGTAWVQGTQAATSTYAAATAVVSITYSK